ncbi:leucine-rich repeat-containing protein 28-like [Styela clava]
MNDNCCCHPSWLRAVTENGIVLLNYGNLENLPTNRLCSKHRLLAKMFYVKRNRIKELPVDISLQYPEITEIYLTSNQLCSLPQSIGDLINLRNLDVCDNELEYLPDSITTLENLKQLRVRHNILKSLPYNIGNASSLEVLDASHNELRSVPCSIGNCKDIYQLLLSNNRLYSLPRQVCFLTHLEQLSITSNCISNLPMDLGKHSTLSIIEMGNNPLLHFCPSYFLSKYCHFDGCAQVEIGREHDFHDVTLAQITSRDSYTISLPSHVKSYASIKIVPSLMEITSRIVNFFSERQHLLISENDLSGDIFDRLESPLGHCYYCSKPIFWSCYAVVNKASPCKLRHSMSIKNFYFLSYFCSPECLLLHLFLQIDE